MNTLGRIMIFSICALSFQSAPAQILKTTKEGQALQLVGSGVRSKKVLLMNISVYKGQLFITDPTKFKKSSDGALTSLSDAGPVAFQMTFLREVDSEKILTSFKEALSTNKIDPYRPEIKKFFDAVKAGGEVKEGKTITLLGLPGKTEDTLTYEDGALKTTQITGPRGFIRDLFSIWLGVPADYGLERLKSEILH